MGLGIGHGLNDEPSIADAWRYGLAKKQQLEPRDDSAWLQAIVTRVPAAVSAAIDKGEKQIEVGAFLPGHLPDGRGEFYPAKDELRDGAVQLYEFCQKAGLRLFVGGDFKMSGRWSGPFEVILRLE